MRINHRLIQSEFNGYKLERNAVLQIETLDRTETPGNDVADKEGVSYAWHKARMAALRRNRVRVDGVQRLERSIGTGGMVAAGLLAACMDSQRSVRNAREGNAGEDGVDLHVVDRAQGDTLLRVHLPIASAPLGRNLMEAEKDSSVERFHLMDMVVHGSSFLLLVHQAVYTPSDATDRHALIVYSLNLPFDPNCDPADYSLPATKRAERTIASEVVRAMASTPALAAFFEPGGSSVMIVHSDAVRPYTAQYPSDALPSKPQMNETLEVTSIETQPKSPWDPSISSANEVSATTAKTSLAALDDAMDDEDDGFYSQQDAHNAEGIVVLRIRLKPNPDSNPVETKTLVPACSFLCTTIPQASVSNPARGLPLLCLKSSVDGIVCAIRVTETGAVELEHVDTMHAFAYIAGSKSDKRFMYILDPPQGLPSGSDGYLMGCVVESNRYAYVYRKKARDENGMQWVVDLWGDESAQRRGAVYGDVNGVWQNEQGHLVISCEDRTCILSFPSPPQ
ncbi:hypothetical protein HDU78_010702 [Chytriomyces hyalinus]|nr:hypothetical protein HDU78_010702 [Chytriomyces hyalinus]